MAIDPQLLSSLALLLLALAVLWLAFELRQLHRRLARPTTYERVARMNAQTEVNHALLEVGDRKRDLARFALSEAAVLGFLGDLEEQVLEAETEEAAIAAIARDDRSRWQRAKDWIRDHRGAIAEKLLGKVNDLVKSAIPGASKSE